MYKPSQSSKTTYTKRKIRQKQTFHLKVHCNNTAITDLIKGKAKHITQSELFQNLIEKSCQCTILPSVNTTYTYCVNERFNFL
jgi:hypothetical protein